MDISLYYSVKHNKSKNGIPLDTEKNKDNLLINLINFIGLSTIAYFVIVFLSSLR